MARSGLGRRRRGRMSPAAILTLTGILAIASFMCVSFGAMFVELNSMGLGIDRAGTALGLIFAAAVAGLLVFDVHYAIAALLLGSDLTLLIRAPLSPGQILLIKLIDSLPRTSAMITVLAIPAVVAFSWSHPLPLWGWALVPIQLVALWALPLGLGLCGALLLIRLVPVRRARDVLALLSTLVVLVLWLLNAFVLPRAVETDAATVEHLRAWLMPRPESTWISPPHWAGSAIAAAARGDAARALGWTGWLVLGTLVSFGLAAMVTRRYLDEALARVSIDPRLVRGGSRPVSPARFHRGWRPLLLKDARLLIRDWTVLGDVLIGALLWGLLPLVFRSFQAFEPQLLMRATLLTLTIGLGFEVGTRAVPSERSGLAWSRLAPIPLSRWHLLKLVSGLAVSLPILIAATLVLAFTLRPPAPMLLESFGTGLSSLVVALSAGLWVGWRFGDPTWTHPRAMLTFAGRIVSGVMLIVLAGMWFAILGVADVVRAQLPPGAFLWGPPALALMLAAVALGRAIRRASRYEWMR